MSKRLAALGGVAGPAAFVTAWAVLGTRAESYSPVSDPISRLAAVGAPTRSAMTAGFLAFGIGAASYGWELRKEAPAAGAAVFVNALATAGVAAFPLGGAGGDTLHAMAAGTAYASLAAVPLLASRARSRPGILSSPLSAATAAAIAIALGASTVVPRGVGLAQRLGLTMGDVWIAASAVALLRRAGRVRTE